MTVVGINEALNAGDRDVAPEFSEEALALEFARRHANELRFVAAWSRWLSWDGTCWRKDETRKVFSLARALCREVAPSANKPNEAKRIASAKTRAAVVALAGEDRRLAATIEQWDTNPWLLNTPGGVVDLRTGTMRPHRPADYMTKITAVAPGGECPRWKAFLKKVTTDDADFVRYLMRVAGYVLTGDIGEHALFFLCGTGGNGKSQFLLAISGVMGDYADTSPIETFTESQTDRHPTELAKLMGARLVTSVEPEQGRRWSETRIKYLTGGDLVDARFMRQDFFQFKPQFKLLFAGNNKPGLRSVDEAIRRRMNMLPFTVKISEEEKIKNFADELVRDEGPGILQWMIDGCLEWQRIGLAPPAAVKSATDKYIADENVLLRWVEERCLRDAQAKTPSIVLFNDWKEWAEERNVHVGNSKSFNQGLDGLGFERGGRVAQGESFLGLKLDPNPPF